MPETPQQIKSREIKEFQQAKAEQIKKTSAFNGATSVVAALITAGLVKEAEFFTKHNFYYTELLKDMRLKLDGVPF